MSAKESFIVQFFKGFTPKQLFFIAWIAIVGLFVMLMMSFYKKRTRRNFREPERPLRRLDRKP